MQRQDNQSNQSKREALEIPQTDIPEIVQPNIREIEQSTAQPDKDSTDVQSEEIRYDNADRIYE